MGAPKTSYEDRQGKSAAEKAAELAKYGTINFPNLGIDKELTEPAPNASSSSATTTPLMPTPYNQLVGYKGADVQRYKDLITPPEGVATPKDLYPNWDNLSEPQQRGLLEVFQTLKEEKPIDSNFAKARSSVDTTKLIPYGKKLSNQAVKNATYYGLLTRDDYGQFFRSYYDADGNKLQELYPIGKTNVDTGEYEPIKYAEEQGWLKDSGILTDKNFDQMARDRSIKDLGYFYDPLQRFKQSTSGLFGGEEGQYYAPSTMRTPLPQEAGSSVLGNLLGGATTAVPAIAGTLLTGGTGLIPLTVSAIGSTLPTALDQARSVAQGERKTGEALVNTGANLALNVGGNLFGAGLFGAPATNAVTKSGVANLQNTIGKLPFWQRLGLETANATLGGIEGERENYERRTNFNPNAQFDWSSIPQSTALNLITSAGMGGAVQLGAKGFNAARNAFGKGGTTTAPDNQPFRKSVSDQAAVDAVLAKITTKQEDFKNNVDPKETQAKVEAIDKQVEAQTGGVANPAEVAIETAPDNSGLKKLMKDTGLKVKEGTYEEGDKVGEKYKDYSPVTNALDKAFTLIYGEENNPLRTATTPEEYQAAINDMITGKKQPNNFKVNQGLDEGTLDPTNPAVRIATEGEKTYYLKSVYEQLADFFSADPNPRVSARNALGNILGIKDVPHADIEFWRKVAETTSKPGFDLYNLQKKTQTAYDATKINRTAPPTDRVISREEAIKGTAVYNQEKASDLNANPSLANIWKTYGESTGMPFDDKTLAQYAKAFDGKTPDDINAIANQMLTQFEQVENPDVRNALQVNTMTLADDAIAKFEAKAILERTMTTPKPANTATPDTRTTKPVQYKDILEETFGVDKKTSAQQQAAFDKLDEQGVQDAVRKIVTDIRNSNLSTDKKAQALQNLTDLRDRTISTMRAKQQVAGYTQRPEEPQTTIVNNEPLTFGQIRKQIADYLGQPFTDAQVKAENAAWTKLTPQEAVARAQEIANNLNPMKSQLPKAVVAPLQEGLLQLADGKKQLAKAEAKINKIFAEPKVEVPVQEPAPPAPTPLQIAKDGMANLVTSFIENNKVDAKTAAKLGEAVGTMTDDNVATNTTIIKDLIINSGNKGVSKYVTQADNIRTKFGLGEEAKIALNQLQGNVDNLALDKSKVRAIKEAVDNTAKSSDDLIALETLSVEADGYPLMPANKVVEKLDSWLEIFGQNPQKYKKVLDKLQDYKDLYVDRKVTETTANITEKDAPQNLPDVSLSDVEEVAFTGLSTYVPPTEVKYAFEQFQLGAAHEPDLDIASLKPVDLTTQLSKVSPENQVKAYNTIIDQFLTFNKNADYYNWNYEGGLENKKSFVARNKSAIAIVKKLKDEANARAATKVVDNYQKLLEVIRPIEEGETTATNPEITPVKTATSKEAKVKLQQAAEKAAEAKKKSQVDSYEESQDEIAQRMSRGITLPPSITNVTTLGAGSSALMIANALAPFTGEGKDEKDKNLVESTMSNLQWGAIAIGTVLTSIALKKYGNRIPSGYNRVKNLMTGRGLNVIPDEATIKNKMLKSKFVQEFAPEDRAAVVDELYRTEGLRAYEVNEALTAQQAVSQPTKKGNKTVMATDPNSPFNAITQIANDAQDITTQINKKRDAAYKKIAGKITFSKTWEKTTEAYGKIFRAATQAKLDLKAEKITQTQYDKLIEAINSPEFIDDRIRSVVDNQEEYNQVKQEYDWLREYQLEEGKAIAEKEAYLAGAKDVDELFKTADDARTFLEKRKTIQDNFKKLVKEYDKKFKKGEITKQQLAEKTAQLNDNFEKIWGTEVDAEAKAELVKTADKLTELNNLYIKENYIDLWTSQRNEGDLGVSYREKKLKAGINPNSPAAQNIENYESVDPADAQINIMSYSKNETARTQEQARIEALLQPQEQPSGLYKGYVLDLDGKPKLDANGQPITALFEKKFVDRKNNRSRKALKAQFYDTIGKLARGKDVIDISENIDEANISSLKSTIKELNKKALEAANDNPDDAALVTLLNEIKSAETTLAELSANNKGDVNRVILEKLFKTLNDKYVQGGYNTNARGNANFGKLTAKEFTENHNRITSRMMGEIQDKFTTDEAIKQVRNLANKGLEDTPLMNYYIDLLEIAYTSSKLAGSQDPVVQSLVKFANKFTKYKAATDMFVNLSAGGANLLRGGYDNFIHNLAATGSSLVGLKRTLESYKPVKGDSEAYANFIKEVAPNIEGSAESLILQKAVNDAKAKGVLIDDPTSGLGGTVNALLHFGYSPMRATEQINRTASLKSYIITALRENNGALLNKLTKDFQTNRAEFDAQYAKLLNEATDHSKKVNSAYDKYTGNYLDRKIAKNPDVSWVQRMMRPMVNSVVNSVRILNMIATQNDNWKQKLGNLMGMYLAGMFLVGNDNNIMALPIGLLNAIAKAVENSDDDEAEKLYAQAEPFFDRVIRGSAAKLGLNDNTINEVMKFTHKGLVATVFDKNLISGDWSAETLNVYALTNIMEAFDKIKEADLNALVEYGMGSQAKKYGKAFRQLATGRKLKFREEFFGEVADLGLKYNLENFTKDLILGQDVDKAIQNDAKYDKEIETMTEGGRRDYLTKLMSNPYIKAKFSNKSNAELVPYYIGKNPNGLDKIPALRESINQQFKTYSDANKAMKKELRAWLEKGVDKDGKSIIDNYRKIHKIPDTQEVLIVDEILDKIDQKTPAYFGAQATLDVLNKFGLNNEFQLPVQFAYKPGTNAFDAITTEIMNPMDKALEDLDEGLGKARKQKDLDKKN